MVYEYNHGADRNFRFLSLLLRFDRFRFFASAARNNNTHVRARITHTRSRKPWLRHRTLMRSRRWLARSRRPWV